MKSLDILRIAEGEAGGGGAGDAGGDDIGAGEVGEVLVSVVIVSQEFKGEVGGNIGVYVGISA